MCEQKAPLPPSSQWAGFRNLATINTIVTRSEQFEDFSILLSTIFGIPTLSCQNTFNFVVMMITVDTKTIFTDVALITLRRMCEILDCSQVSFEDQTTTNVHKCCLFRILWNSFFSSAFGHFVVHQTYHGLPHVKRSLKHQLWSCW